MKYIHAVDYDRVKTEDGNFPKTRIVGETYPDEFSGEEKTVNAISDIIKNNQRTILICYTDGSDEEVVEFTNIYKRSTNG
jgi:hypothetical protein